MSLLDRVDPALHPLATMALWTGLLADALPEARANAAAGERVSPAPDGLARDEVAVPHKETELHVYPGVVHAFELAAAFKAPVALWALAERRQGFERAFPERRA